MRIVLAGGSGFLGQALTRSLSQKGHLVIVLTRGQIAPGGSNLAGVRYTRWDGRTGGPWTQQLGGADAIINLSGASLGDGRWTPQRKEVLLNSRVNATTALVEALRTVASRPTVLINASATGYYGHVPEGELDESSPAGSDFLATVCRSWEAAAEAAERLGVRVVRVRTGFVIGREAPAFQRMMTPFRFFAGAWYGRGLQWFPWIHLRDVVSGYLHALENASLSGPVNLVAPESIRMREFSKLLGSIVGRPAWMPVPAVALRILLGEMSNLLITGQRAIPRKLQHIGFAFAYPRIREALSQAILAAD